ncbi:carbohydrate ABC transporter permease [Falsibacillus albus]|uniref:Carbohydrate ABC transporter permease n=1 Tax=Falsibacillus albus TaxID=2478915 RepID=A0A3L7K265_9BACI|nr:carbohydrate ABC transporter permease [Falsibacillus albus]RLQ94782.1 carbohydrate ABC transporter permease [Falsibacillus albus]
MNSLSKKIKFNWIVVHLLLIAYSLTVVYPAILVIFNSFKSTSEIFASPYGLPKSFSFTNYINAWNEANFGVYFKNSIFVTAISVFLVLLIASLAAYVLARFKFKGSFVIYFLFLLGLMLPIRLAIIPLYILIRDLGLLDTYTGLILVYVASGLSFSIFILYTFFKSIPDEMVEAARIEGANSFQIYYKIMLPLVRPALSTVAIFNFMSYWNDFFFPYILIKDESLYTVPVGISNFFGEYTTDWSLLFAALALSIIPVVIVFFVMSKQFIEGLTAGAMK